MRKLTVAKLVQKIDLMRNKTTQVIESTAANRAEAVVKLFKQNIKGGKFQPPLKPETIKAKRKKGMPLPQVPLYGWGESEKNSMYNGLRIKKLGNGKYEIKPYGKHVDGKTKKQVNMQLLFAVHETGAHLKNGGKIPARKPLQRTVEMFVKQPEYKDYLKKQAQEFAKAKK